MYHSFYGAESLEEAEIRLKTESIILDSEMIDRGESALFSSVYDALYLKNRKKIIEQKTDADIVDSIFKEKLNKSKPKVEKPKGLAAFQKKDDINEKQSSSRSIDYIANASDRQYIISLFR